MEKEYTLPDLYDCTGDCGWIYRAMNKISNFIPKGSTLGCTDLKSFGPWNYQMGNVKIKIYKERNNNPKIVVSSKDPDGIMELILSRFIKDAPIIKMQAESKNSLELILNKELQKA